MDIDTGRNLHHMSDIIDNEGLESLFASIERFVKDEPDAEVKAEKEKEIRQQLEKKEEEFHALLSSGWPKMAVLALDRVTTEETLWKAARGQFGTLCRKPGAVISLNGPCGTGKTVMATSIARGMVRLGRRSKYAKSYDFCRDLREAQRASDVEIEFKRPYFLALDEFHELKDSEFSQGAIDRLIDARHQAGKITVIISNIRPSDIEAYLGASITSRMHMVGGIIPCEWGSFREIKAKC